MATRNDDCEEVKAKPERDITASGKSTSGRIHLPKSLKSMFKHKGKDGAESSFQHEHREVGKKQAESKSPRLQHGERTNLESNSSPKGIVIQDSISTEEHATDRSLCVLPLSISKIKQLQLQRVSQQRDKPQVYMLHTTKKFQDRYFTRYAVGSPPLTVDRLNMTSERVLMLVGATGTGKTTLINGIANYIYGTKWEDDFRLKVIHDEGQRSQAYGQTKQIAAYTFPVQKGSPLLYPLTVIDTPGFGDSDGVMHDRHIVEQINEFFSLKPPGGITFLNGIGFVVKASDGRLTPMQHYVFNSILSIFGRDVEENIFVIMTFCDAEKPVVLNALKEAHIPYHGKGYKFNNSALFAEKEVGSEGKHDDDDDDENDDSVFNSSFF